MMKNIVKLNKIYRSAVLIGMIFSFRPAICASNFLSNIGQFLRPSVFFKPTIDACKAFWNPSYIEEFVAKQPEEIIKKSINTLMREGSSAPHHERSALVKRMFESLKNGHEYGSSSTTDYAPAFVFGFFSVVAAVLIHESFTCLREISQNKGSLKTFKEKLKETIYPLAKVVGYSSGLALIVNFYFAPLYFDHKVSSSISQSISDAAKDTEAFRLTVTTLYDAVTAEKILNVFDKGVW